MGPWALSIVGWLALAGAIGEDALPLELEPPHALPVSTGAAGPAIERRELTLHGLPVRGAYEVHERRASGPEGRVAARQPRFAPRLRPHEARVDREALLQHLRERGLGSPRSEPRLVYRMVLGHPVLAWEVELPLRLLPGPSLPTVWLSAATGTLLHESDAAFGSRARVFPKNPATTPDAVEVELRTLDLAEAGLPLDSEGLAVFGCGPGPYDAAPAWGAGYNCVPQPFARSDEAGDFFVPLPDVGLIADNRAFHDPYAEVAAYHHVETFFAVMQERGLSGRRCERFEVLANMHAIEEDGALRPIDGASFIDSCNLELTPTLVLGQGVDADYAWDADVVYHELGHSIVQQLSPAGLNERRYGPLGILSEAGAINEGLADYFAMSVSGDPEVAEYVGRVTVSSGAPYLRTGETSKVCPDDLVADWYADSLPLSSALWAIRWRLGPVADQLVLRVLPRLSPDALLDEAGAELLAVAHQLHDEGELDDFGLGLVARSLRARGLLGCLHVIEDPGLATTGKRMTLVAADERIVPFAPGPLQLRYEVPADGHEVTVFFSLGGGEPAERAMSVLVSRDGQPITFDFEFLEEDGDERIEVSGDHELELPAESLNGEDFIVRLEVEPGEVLHVALANRSPFGVTASNVFVVASEPTGGPPEDPQDDEREDDGCGCRSRGSGSGRPWLVSIAWLAWRRRARRRSA
ncbi:MAG: hypothetical protein H6712_21465 [Myxococcales bacterium]|nr:hypothetical protein [Myxococcales bacterium]MCB9716446.1 hypothetical protein [Myxococcales bacterium]